MSPLEQIQQQGYREEDLTPEQQDIIYQLRLLQEAFLSHYEYDAASDYMVQPETNLAYLLQEVADSATTNIQKWLDLYIANKQIALAEAK